MMAIPNAAASDTDRVGAGLQREAVRDWFGQPRGLTILCAVEMWEVFSMQGIRTLLVYYMTRQLLFAQGDASTIYGTFLGFVFLTPLLGGVIADRRLGRRNSAVIGGVIMAIGYFMLMSPTLFYPALVVLACGNGLYKPCVASQIRELYEEGDPRRDSAYSIFYAGKNLGALLAPLGCGTVGELFGWYWGFGLAGVSMIAGVLVYLLGARYLSGQPAADPQTTVRGARAMHAPPVKLSARRLVQLTCVAFSVILFSCAYEQLGNTFALWVGASVDRSVGGRIIPMTWFQSLNPLFVFVFTPVLIWSWTALSRKGRQPEPIMKMASGALMLCVGYLVLAGFAASAARHGGQVSALPVVLFIALYTIGELHVLPIGLGLFSRLAPPSMAATLLGIWYLTSFVGNLAAGQIGRLWSQLSQVQFFLMLSALAAAAATILLIARDRHGSEPGRLVATLARQP